MKAGYTRVWDSESKVPYAHGKEQWTSGWVGYDDKESLEAKVLSVFVCIFCHYVKGLSANQEAVF